MAASSRADRIAFIGDRRSDVHLLVADAGVKAVSLARLDRLGLRVPPAIVLGTALSQEFRRRGSLPPGFSVRLAAAIREIEEATGLTLGGEKPLLLSVRPSPVVTMPALMPAVLNTGLSEARVPDLVRRSGNAWLAWDCYRRFARGFAVAVDGLPPEPFDRLTESHLARARARALDELDPMSMRDLARASADLRRVNGAPPLPADPLDQLVRAVEAVLVAWHAPHAEACRRVYGVDDTAGIAVLVQSMVFGNWSAQSGAGQAFTHGDPMRVNFAFNTQGTDDHRDEDDATLLRLALPGVWSELETARLVVRHELEDVRHVDFTVEDGCLYFLQTHSTGTLHGLPSTRPALAHDRPRVLAAAGGHRRLASVPDVRARGERRPSAGVADDVREERSGCAGADSA